jgi:serine protease Do
MIRPRIFPQSARITPAVLTLALALSQISSAMADEDAEAVQQAKGLSRAFRSAAKAVLPTVVQVRTLSTSQNGGRNRSRNPFQGTPLEDLYEGRGSGSRSTPQPGLGSGVIIDPSGIILTNNHVITGADKVVVQLADGRVFEASDIKTDPETDLAVMTIKSDETFPAAEMGDSDKLDIGDWVIAIGNPFALESTVSAGIISAKGRSLDKVRRAKFLQTDAAINPGNSGGPLVNLDGQIIGINTAIFSQSGGYQGIGFAIPINLAEWVTPQLIKNGSVKRAYLGISMDAITAENSKRLGVEPNQGVVIVAVIEDSPASQAGLLRDDVVLDFDGRKIENVSDLQQVVERLEWDTEHQIKILRKKKPQTIKVTIREMPDGFGQRLGGGIPNMLEESAEIFRSRELGLIVMDLSPSSAQQYGYEDDSGVLILDVAFGGIAAQSGIKKEMVIRRVGDKPVKNVAEFKAAMKDLSLEQGIKLEIHTPKGSQTITLKRK